MGSKFKTGSEKLKEAGSKIFVIQPDQLSLAKIKDADISGLDAILFCESYDAYRRLPFHKQKITFELSCQRHFAQECEDEGFEIVYLQGDDMPDQQIRNWLHDNREAELFLFEPSEWNAKETFSKLETDFNGRVSVLDNPFFMAEAGKWKDKIGEGYRMEYFYRDMRRDTGYLMDGDKPEGGDWNYDKDNRKKLPKGHKPPAEIRFEQDDITSEVAEFVADNFPDAFGKAEEFNYAVTRKEALKAADDFFENRMELFGPYEDAMAEDERLIYHSGLSMYINNGLLTPEELCDRAEAAYREGNAPIQSVEGFIRQIIGWREFIRIYYLAMMPDVKTANAFKFQKGIPQFFWDGKTKMRCVQAAVLSVIDTGYTHHIPRLMVLSNISNLTESDPHELYLWFWYGFVDAWDWVVLPNVLGMSTFADGGVLASKPYVSSGNYINKMSNHCSSCAYSVSKKLGEKACPFNYLYWNFVGNHEEAFEENGRVSFMVNMYRKKSDEEKKQIREQSHAFIEGLERYETN